MGGSALEPLRDSQNECGVQGVAQLLDGVSAGGPPVDGGAALAGTNVVQRAVTAAVVQDHELTSASDRERNSGYEPLRCER